MCFENSKCLKKSQSSSHFYHELFTMSCPPKKDRREFILQRGFSYRLSPNNGFFFSGGKGLSAEAVSIGEKGYKNGCHTTAFSGVTAILFQTIGIYDYSTTSEPNMALRYKHPQ